MNREDLKEDILREPSITYGQQVNLPCFIDPLEDLMFKRLFGAEQNKDLTITFLNHILKGKREVVTLEFLKNEYPGETSAEGGVVIDLICKDQKGAFFVIEMQKKLAAKLQRTIVILCLQAYHRTGATWQPQTMGLCA